MSKRFVPTLLDTFSGIGGFSLAFESVGFETSAFLEYEPIKRAVLDHWWPAVPKYGNIREFDCVEFLRTHGRPHVITGGVPCQPTSLLGARLGTADERWLWPESIRLVRELRPDYAVLENPTAILTLEDGRAFNGIVSEMAALGYDGWWDVISAAAFGAGHWRERLCIVFADAHNVNGRPRRESGGEDRRQTDNGDSQSFPPHANCKTKQGKSGELRSTKSEPEFDQTESNYGNGNQNLEAFSTDTDCLGWKRPGNLEGPRNPTSRKNREIDFVVHDDSQTVLRLPDLRGRVTGPEWWMEIVGGIPRIPSKVPADERIPVMASGIPNKLVEAASLCIGDSVVPQAWVPIAKTIYDRLMHRYGATS